MRQPWRGGIRASKAREFSRRRGAGTTPALPAECTPHCRRRKVRLTPFPPDGENCARSLAPPLPTGTAPLGSCGGPIWRPKKRTGRARSKRKNAFAVGLFVGFQESLCPRRGAGGGLDLPDTLFFSFRLRSKVASTGLGEQAFLRPPTLTAGMCTRGKPIQRTRPARAGRRLENWWQFARTAPVL